MSVIVFLLLLIISLALSSMTAAYATLSTSHLRHWAQRRDAAASKLYPLRARGSAALLTLELLRAIFLAATITFLAVNMSAWLAGFIAALIFFGAFVLLTQLYLKSFGIRLLVWLSAPILAVTHGLRIVMLPLGRMLDSFLANEPVTLTREDLEKTIKEVSAEDTNLSGRELLMLHQSLGFTRKSVHDSMQPKSHLSLISINEILTPVVLNELHGSGQDYFPVMATDNKTVVGLLSMQEVMDIKKHPSVEETMHKAQFINEEEPLTEVVDQFYASKQPVFIAVNSKGGIAGLLSIDAVLKEILGEARVDEAAAEEALSDEAEPEAGRVLAEEQIPEGMDENSVEEVSGGQIAERPESVVE